MLVRDAEYNHARNAGGSARLRDLPAAADIAFCVVAYGCGMDEAAIEQSLTDDYLSRDPSPSTRAAYIRRTMAKARDWVAPLPALRLEIGGGGRRPARKRWPVQTERSK